MTFPYLLGGNQFEDILTVLFVLDFFENGHYTYFTQRQKKSKFYFSAVNETFCVIYLRPKYPIISNQKLRVQNLIA